MKISVITVNYNGREHIISQLASVRAGARDLSVEQIVSDNGSTDGSVEEIRKLFPEVKIVENGKNVGFGAANNSGLKLATGDYILFLNPDMLLLPNTLSQMVATMEGNQQIGILGPRLNNSAGEYSSEAGPRRFPTFWNQVAIMLKIHHLFPQVLDSYLYKGFDYTKDQSVDSIRGSFMLVRRELINTLGWGFDPRYFIWFEDVDLCKEAYRHGYEVWYCAVAGAVDYVGQTFKKQPSLMKQKWFTASMIIYFAKWHPVWQSMVLKVFRPISLFLVWAQQKIAGR